MSLIAGLGAGIASALGGIYDSITGAKVQRENVDKTIQANKQMAEYQYSKDLEMWNRGNVYNSPQAQMERLKSAGLNPNLIYGSGGATTVAGQLPKYNAPTQEYSYQPPVRLQDALGSGLGSFQDIQIKQAQLDNLRAQRNAIVQSTLNKEKEGDYLEEWLQERNFGAGMKNYWGNMISQNAELAGRIKNKWAQEYAPHQLDALIARNKLMAEQMNNLLANTEYKKLQSEYYLGTSFGPMGLNLLKSFGGGLTKMLLGNKKALPKVAPRVNPNNWPKFKR